MPYNFLTKKFYTTVYEDLFAALKNSIYFKYETEYIKSWRKIFEYLDTQPLNLPEQFITSEKDPDIFQYSFNTVHTRYLIHFYIDGILASIKKNSLSISTETLSKFGLYNSEILYSREIYTDYHVQAQNPIVLVPFPLGTNTSYIVIDGNHRVTAKIATKCKTINLQLYYPESRNDFCSEYDWVIYLFYMEIFHFSKLCSNGCSMKQLIRYSNLNNSLKYMLT